MSNETYLVWCPELGSGPEDGREITTFDAESAARIWARREDAESADYWIVGGSGTTVIVRGPLGTEWTIAVTGEPAVEYHSRVQATQTGGGQ